MPRKRRFDPSRGEVVFSEGELQTAHFAIEVTQEEREWADFEDTCRKLCARISPPGKVRAVATADKHAAYQLLLVFSRREEGGLLPAPLLDAIKRICGVADDLPVTKANWSFFLAAARAEAGNPAVSASNPLSGMTQNEVAAAVWPEDEAPAGGNHPRRSTISVWREKPEYRALVANERDSIRRRHAFVMQWKAARAREREKMKKEAIQARRRDT